MHHHEWTVERPMLFPNDEIYLAFCSIGKEAARWHVPAALKNALAAYVGNASYGDLLDPDFIWRLMRWINRELSFELPVVQCRLSVSYMLPEAWSPLCDNGKARWKTDLDEATVDLSKPENISAVKSIRSYPFAGFVQEHADIASVAFCTESGAHTVLTARPYRNRGHATATLNLLASRCLAAGIRCGHATEAVNIASRRVAERCGFVHSEYMYWITFPPTTRTCVPDWVERDLNVLKFPG